MAEVVLLEKIMKMLTKKIDNIILHMNSTKARSIAFAIIFPILLNIIISIAVVIVFHSMYEYTDLRLQLITNTIVFIILLYVYIRTSKLFDQYDSEKNVKNLILILSLGFVISSFGNAISRVLMEVFGFVEDNLTVETILKASIPEALLLTCVSAPLTEEIIFRGFIFKTINKYHGFWASAIISSILFGISHITPLSMAFAFMCGIFLSYVYYLYKSIFMCMILHMMVNFSSLAIHYLMQSEPSLKETYFILFICLVLIIMITLRLHISCKMNRQDNV